MSHEEKGDTITFERINKAVSDLYGGWENMPELTKEAIQEILNEKHYEDAYHKFQSKESDSLKILQLFETRYPNTLNSENIDNVLGHLGERRGK